LKEEALDRTLWRTRFGRGYGPVVRQTAEWMMLVLPAGMYEYVARITEYRFPVGLLSDGLNFIASQTPNINHSGVTHVKS
jgi:hypothetical protein